MRLFSRKRRVVEKLLKINNSKKITENNINHESSREWIIEDRPKPQDKKSFAAEKEAKTQCIHNEAPKKRMVKSSPNKKTERQKYPIT